MNVFGPMFSRTLVAGCRMLSTPECPVPVEWTLAKIALESGFNPFAEHPGTHARGLWQKMPREIARIPAGGEVPAIGPLDFTIAQADGSTRIMRKYACPAPEVQLVEAFPFWRSFRGEGFRCREALYCANIAPARLRRPYDDRTIIYSADPADAHLPDRTYWPAAYHANAGVFGKNPKATGPEAKFLMRDLAVGLDYYVGKCRARYDAELAAARAVGG